MTNVYFKTLSRQIRLKAALRGRVDSFSNVPSQYNVPRCLVKHKIRIKCVVEIPTLKKTKYFFTEWIYHLAGISKPGEQFLRISYPRRLSNLLFAITG